MPTLFPFQCFRPSKSFVHRFTKKPSDYSSLERSEGLENLMWNSYFSISQPEVFGQSIEDSLDRFGQLIRKGVIFTETDKALYLYEIRFNNHQQIGIVGQQSALDLFENKIKTHENTRSRNINFLTKRMEILHLNSNPLYTFFTENQDEFIEQAIVDTRQTPILQLNITENEQHYIYKLSPDQFNFYISLLEPQETTYLADGHHRLEAIKNLVKPSDRVTTILFPSKQMLTFSFARILRDLTQDQEQHIKKLILENQSQNSHYSTEVYYKNNWIKSGQVETKQELYQFLDDTIIKKGLQIESLHDNEQILFYKDRFGRESITGFIENIGAQFGFRLPSFYPDEIKQIADNKQNLPAKSTFFYPKPREGIFITRI